MKLFSIEGNHQRLDGGAMFGNAPKEMWKNWMQPDEKNRILLSCRALLLKSDEGKNILLESGVGTFFEPKLRERYGIVENEHMLLKNLQHLGLEPNDIDAIILSHLHFDHAGGILAPYEDGVLRLLFPKADYYISKAQWERSQSPHAREKASFIPHLNKLLEESGRLHLVEGKQNNELPDNISFSISNGHTIGLLLTHIALDSGPLVFASDLIPGLPWMHLSLSMGYDRFPELLLEEKKDLLEKLLVENGKVFFTHDPNCATAWVKKDEKGKFYGQPTDLV